MSQILTRRDFLKASVALSALPLALRDRDAYLDRRLQIYPEIGRAHV